MKLLITADIHCGVQGRIDDCIWVIETIRQYAKNNNIKDVLVLGDLFHDRVSLNIEVLTKTYNKLEECQKDGQIWTIMCGNHDMFLKNSWEINSLRTLHKVSNIIEDITNIEIDHQRYHILPFIHYEDKYMEELSKINKNSNDNDILLTHIGVAGAILNECFLLKNWSAVNFDNTKFKKVFTGHFHCYQSIGDRVWYPGSPIPFRFDEGLVDHGFIVYDPDNNTHEFIKMFEIDENNIKPPDFVTIPDDSLIENISRVPGNNIKVILSHEYTSNELNKIKNILKKKGAINVNWAIPKKHIEEVKEISESSNNNDPEALFKSYIEVHKPDLDIGLLLELHKEISAEAEEKFVLSEDDEEPND
jgi:DNA repair exonuclease SbcCD nuclease subunit